MYSCINFEATGKNLKAYRLKANLKVSQVQDVFGFMYPNAIYKWEKGECLPDLTNFVVLEDIYHATLDELLVVDRAPEYMMEGRSERDDLSAVIGLTKMSLFLFIYGKCICRGFKREEV